MTFLFLSCLLGTPIPSLPDTSATDRCVPIHCEVETGPPAEQRGPKHRIRFDANTKNTAMTVDDRIDPPLVAKVTQSCMPSGGAPFVYVALQSGSLEVTSAGLGNKLHALALANEQVTAQIFCAVDPKDDPKSND